MWGVFFARLAEFVQFKAVLELFFVFVAIRADMLADRTLELDEIIL